MVHMGAKAVKRGLITQPDTTPVVGHMLHSAVIVGMKYSAPN